MTEAEWLAAVDPQALMDHLATAQVARTKHGRRQLRLFGCACCRRVWHLLVDERSRRGVEISERYAEGLAGKDELSAAESACGAVGVALYRESYPGRTPQLAAAEAAWMMAFSGDARGLALSAARLTAEAAGEARDAARARQCVLLRDIFGNPFRPLAAHTFPVPVVGVARSIADGDRALYPVLADALEELGAAAAAGHCREDVHVKGCHVVDWVRSVY